jgi:hypothetical protein
VVAWVEVTIGVGGKDVDGSDVRVVEVDVDSCVTAVVDVASVVDASEEGSVEVVEAAGGSSLGSPGAESA